MITKTIQNAVTVVEKLGLDENAAQFAVAWLDRDLQSKKDEIVRCATHLQQKMQRLVANFNDDGIEANFNSLGEVQGTGSELDRLLGELTTMRKMYETLSKIR